MWTTTDYSRNSMKTFTVFGVDYDIINNTAVWPVYCI